MMEVISYHLLITIFNKIEELRSRKKPISTITMCFYIEEVFLKCQHTKGSYPASRCNLPSPHPVNINRNILSSPGYCAPCLRNIEESISRRFNPIIAEYMAEVQAAQATVNELNKTANVTTNEAGEPVEEGEWSAIDILNHRINKRKLTIESIKQQRNREIQLFRSSENYFADG